MPSTTPNLGLPYPNANDAPDGPGGIFALAAKLDKLGQSWTPTIDTVNISSENGGWVTRIGGMCIGYAFIRLADGNYINSLSQFLNLPIPSYYGIGTKFSIGTVEYTRRSDGAFASGRLMQGNTGNSNSKANFWVDSIAGGGIGTASATNGTPFSIGATDAMFLHVRLQYFTGV